MTITVNHNGDDTFDSWVVAGIPGIEQVEVYATYHEDGPEQRAAIDAARKVAERIALMLADDLTSCRHCGALGADTGGKCPRCERNRDTGK